MKTQASHLVVWIDHIKSLDKGNNIWHEGKGSPHCNLRWATFHEQSTNQARGCYSQWPAEENWLEDEVFTRARVLWRNLQVTVMYRSE